MKLVLLGAPGAGKGTQAEILSRKLNIPTISTGNILRAAMKNGTPVGLKAKSYVESGKLVPDDVIIGIVCERLAEPDCANGYILDGMPRTIPQAEALEQHGIDVDTALSIEIADETIIERMSGRRTCKDCSATFHIVSNPPKVEGKCDFCGGELTIRKDWTSTMPSPSHSRTSMPSAASSSRSITSRPSRPRPLRSRKLWVWNDYHQIRS